MITAACDNLLQPLPGVAPEGDGSHFVLKLAPELRELRREESADEFNDATRPAQLKRADWAEVVRRCERSLAEDAKDLRTACHLVEARTRVAGLAGLRDGLELVARLAGECWDRVTPLAGDDPVDARATPIANLLDDPDRGLCFPSLVRTLPLIGDEENRRSFIDWTRLRGDAASGDELGRLRSQISAECFTQNHNDASASLDWVDALRRALDERLGDDAPGLLRLRSALADLRDLLADELARLGAPAAAGQASHDAPAAQEQNSRLGPVEREQLYTLLDETAERLRVMEPHSPIPYLVKRAVRLGRLPFPSLMRQVIREPATLTELNREFGIAETNSVDASS